MRWTDNDVWALRWNVQALLNSSVLVSTRLRLSVWAPTAESGIANHFNDVFLSVQLILLTIAISGRRALPNKVKLKTQMFAPLEGCTKNDCFVSAKSNESALDPQ